MASAATRFARQAVQERKYKQHSIMGCLYLLFLDGLDAGRRPAAADA
ncbi:MAG TPA: hypothetical protein VFT39_18340 [Vicinamibacterales bacterium]|nr:hypothetical protein [Vicinamibacterales bacterium]